MTDEAIRSFIDLCGGKRGLQKVIRQARENSIMGRVLKDEGQRFSQDIVISDNQKETS